MSDRPVSVSTGAVPYTVSIHDGQHTWSGDTLPANGGADAGPDPESQVLGALGACTAITVSMVAARKQWPLTAVHVHLHYSRRGAAGTVIAREIVLDGALDDDQRARLLGSGRQVPDPSPADRAGANRQCIANRPSGRHCNNPNLRMRDAARPADQRRSARRWSALGAACAPCLRGLQPGWV